MADHTDDIDIDALSAFLLGQPVIGPRWHSALTALVAERDSLKQRVAVLESQEFTLPTDPFRDPDRDLRERLVCAALTGLIAGNYGSEYDSVAIYAIKHADAVLAAMRKGESNDK